MQIPKKRILGVCLLTSLIIFASPTSAQAPPANTPAGGTLAQRVEQRKAERRIQFEKNEENRLKSRCVAVQGNVREIQSKSAPMFAGRNKLYQHIDAKLWVAIGRLKLADQDTFNLEQRRTTFAEKAATFQTASANYLQTIDDIIVINCQADLVGFKALVETARIYHTQLRDQSADIRAYLVDQIKPVISEHATALKPKTAEGDQ